jgi:hypothetical protein
MRAYFGWHGSIVAVAFAAGVVWDDAMTAAAVGVGLLPQALNTKAASKTVKNTSFLYIFYLLLSIRLIA